MQIRNKNIRKSCDKILDIIYYVNFQPFQHLSHDNADVIRKELHKIKRTTWRGEGKKLDTIYIDLSKHLNTNQTTTAIVDVSTIPYY